MGILLPLLSVQLFLPLGEVIALASCSFAALTFSLECQCIDYIVATLNCPWHFVKKTTVFFSHRFISLSSVYTYRAISASYSYSSLHVFYSFDQAAFLLSFIQSSTTVHCFKRGCRSLGTPTPSRCLHRSSRMAATVLKTYICSLRLRKTWSGGEVTALMSSPLYCTIAGCTQLAYLATTFWRLFFILFLSTCTSTSLYNQCYWFCIRYSGV